MERDIHLGRCIFFRFLGTVGIALASSSQIAGRIQGNIAHCALGMQTRLEMVTILHLTFPISYLEYAKLQASWPMIAVSR